VPGHGLAAVEAACAEALEAGLAAGDVILAILAVSANRLFRPASPRPMRCAEHRTRGRLWPL